MNEGPTSLQKRVAYLHHGLLMNSEVWVALTDAERCLPFELVERGFDVWVGSKGSMRVINTDRISWATTGETSIRKSRSIALPRRPSSGTFPSTSSPSTIFPTVSATSSKQPSRRACRILASLKAPPRHLLPSPFTPSSTDKSTCLSLSHQQWPQLGYLTALSIPL